MIADTHEEWKKLISGRADFGKEEEVGHSAPSTVAAGLTRSGSAGALAAMVGAPQNATEFLLGGKDSSSEAESGGLSI